MLAGDAVHKVAADLGVSPSSVRLWRAQAGGDPKTKNTDYSAVVLEHLELAFVALDHILRQTHDPVWLGKQSAAELATLYGVVFDKQARVLAAIRTPGDEPDGVGPDAVDAGPARLPDAAGGADPTS